MSAAGALGASLLAVLAHPRWLFMSLAAFLIRGGLLVLLFPVVQVPSTAALANVLGPTLIGFVFEGPSASFVVLVGVIAGAALAWFVLAGLIGSTLELALVRDAAAGEDLEGRVQPVHGRVRSAFAARSLAHLPTAAAVAWGATTLVEAGYAELISPGDAAIPLVIRVILRTPGPVALVVAAWAVGEAVGGLAVRRLAWGAGIGHALLGSLWDMVRPSGLLVLVLTDLTLVAVVGVGGGLIGIVFDRARTVLIDGGSMSTTWLTLTLLSGAWIGTAVLVSIVAAWRSTAWTYETGRRQPTRTIG